MPRTLEQKLALGIWTVTLLVGKKPELVHEKKSYGLDKVGFTSTHSTASGTKVLDQAVMSFLLWHSHR